MCPTAVTGHAMYRIGMFHCLLFIVTDTKSISFGFPLLKSPGRKSRRATLYTSTASQNQFVSSLHPTGSRDGRSSLHPWLLSYLYSVQTGRLNQSLRQSVALIVR